MSQGRTAICALAAAAIVAAPGFAFAQDDSTANSGRGARRAPLVVPGRSMVINRLGIVASSSPMAASAGIQILEQGGNAIDAALAANATVGLTEPMSFTIGGDLFAMIYIAAENKLYGLNASGWSSSEMTNALLTQRGVTRLSGALTVTVPGAVAGWQAMRDRFGTLPFSTILAPAIYHAENGFPVTEIVAGEWRAAQQWPDSNVNMRETYLVDGRAPSEGELFRNPGLARTYRRIAALGRDAFYTGETAREIVNVVTAGGGVMNLSDLAQYQPEWVEPIATTYRGWKVYEMPPQGQGIGALMMLNIMEQYPYAEWGYKTAPVMHSMIEAKKLAYADIVRYIGDPRFSRQPVAWLLDKSRAAQRAKLIDMNAANCAVPADSLPGITDSEGNETIYLTVVDAAGNIVSLISSVYSVWGSRIAPRGQGFVLHNRGSLFTLQTGQPNTIAPRKRPLHTIIPAFMEKDGTRIGFGIMGGWNQAQAHAQFVSNIADYGLNIQEALEAGRFTQTSFTGCRINIEPLIADSVRAALSGLGHQLVVARPRAGTFGWGQAVMTDSVGIKYGASEPRHDGVALPQAPPVFSGRGRSGGAPRDNRHLPH